MGDGRTARIQQISQPVQLRHINVSLSLLSFHILLLRNDDLRQSLLFLALTFPVFALAREFGSEDLSLVRGGENDRGAAVGCDVGFTGGREVGVDLCITGWMRRKYHVKGQGDR